MRKFALSLFLGLTATGTVLTPITVEAATFDYSRVKNWTVRPIDSNNILDFVGDLSRNEGYITANNLDPNAPDAGHTNISVNGLGYAGYYATGRQAGPDPNATRSTSLEGIKGFSNFFNYLNSNNIPLSKIGFSFGQKNDQDITKTWNLGEDRLGQDWFATPDSPIEERIYRANPDDVELYLSYGTDKIVNLGYSDFFGVADNGPLPEFNDNFNVFLSNPVPALKVAGLDSVASGLADAFLLDVAGGGGSVQVVSEDPTLEAELANINGYRYTTFELPLQIRTVSSRNIPEPSSFLGLLMFGVLGTTVRIIQQKEKRE